MSTILPEPYDSMLLTFFFVYVRVGFMVLAMPVTSNDTVPNPVRAGIAFWLALLLTAPLLGIPGAGNESLVPLVGRDFEGFIAFGIAVAAEAAIGFALGFIGQVLVQTYALAGEIIGQQAGFSAASVFDPVTGQDTFLMAQLKSLFATVLFLVIDGPIIAFQVVATSFQFLPPGEYISFGAYSAAGFHTIVMDENQTSAMAQMMYDIAFRLASPIIATMFLVSLAEAFLARTAPQLNILAVGFAIRIGISLLVLIFMMRLSVLEFMNYLLQLEDLMFLFVERLSTFAG